VQFECSGPNQCDAGETCCGLIPDGDASATLLEFLSASGDAGVHDHWPAGVVTNAFCMPTCDPPRMPLCGSHSDCSGSATCTALAEGNVVLTTLGAETLGVCVDADASTPD
jgi:hypothetical protein